MLTNALRERFCGHKHVDAVRICHAYKQPHSEINAIMSILKDRQEDWQNFGQKFTSGGGGEQFPFNIDPSQLTVNVANRKKKDYKVFYNIILMWPPFCLHIC